jgi:hypothetical protein
MTAGWQLLELFPKRGGSGRKVDRPWVGICRKPRRDSFQRARVFNGPFLPERRWIRLSPFQSSHEVQCCWSEGRQSKLTLTHDSRPPGINALSTSQSVTDRASFGLLRGGEMPPL